MFFPWIIKFHKTGTVHLGRNPFSSYFNKIMFLFLSSMSTMWRAIQKFAFLTFWIGREARTKGLKGWNLNWKLEKSVAFLPSEVLLNVNTSSCFTTIIHWKLQDFTFNLVKIIFYGLKSPPIDQNYWKYANNKILAAYLGILRLDFVRSLQQIINIEFIRHFRMIQLSFFWNTMRIITSLQNHLNLSAFYS